MFRKPIRFALTCFILWPVSIFVAGFLGWLIAPMLWWMARQSGATTLPVFVFDTNAALPLALANGLILGLIPIFRLKTIVLDALTVGRFRAHLYARPENTLDRPILWAWVLPTLFFLVRFATHGIHVEESVLGGTIVTSEPSRFTYFFGPVQNITMSLEYLHFMQDRLYFTLPMLFTGGYALAVLLRHRIPNLRHQRLSDFDGNPPEHKAE